MSDNNDGLYVRLFTEREEPEDYERYIHGPEPDSDTIGKALKQSLAVVLSGKTLKSGTDYTVTYKNNKNVGKATPARPIVCLPNGVVITLIGSDEADSVSW